MQDRLETGVTRGFGLKVFHNLMDLFLALLLSLVLGYVFGATQHGYSNHHDHLKYQFFVSLPKFRFSDLNSDPQEFYFLPFWLNSYNLRTLENLLVLHRISSPDLRLSPNFDLRCFMSIV